MGALALFLLIVVLSFSAPIYAHHVAHTDPFVSNISGTTTVNGKQVDVVGQGTSGLGLEKPRSGRPGIRTTSSAPTTRDATWRRACSTAAAPRSRSASSLRCSAASRRSCSRCWPASSGGWLDSVLSRVMDLIWAFPVYLLSISLATVLLTTPAGVKLGFVTINPSSLWVPTLIIAFVYIPYVFRPVRGQVLSVREKEYVEASISQGASSLGLMFSEILPNVISTVIVLLPLMIATTVLTEAALSFLSIGVQAPQASWGTVIEDGQGLLYTRPWVAIAPGIMIVLTVLSLNVLGDGVRDALDPRAKVRARE